MRFGSAVRRGLLYVNAMDPIRVIVKCIVAPLVRYEQKNQQTTRNTEGQADDVDRRIAEVLSEVSKGNDGVVAEHGTMLVRRSRGSCNQSIGECGLTHVAALLHGEIAL